MSFKGQWRPRTIIVHFVSFLPSWGASSRGGGLEYATVAGFRSMIGENRQVVTDKPVEVQECREFTDHFRGIYRVYTAI